MAVIAGADDSLKIPNAVTLPDFRARGRITAGRDVFTINAALWQTRVKSRFTLEEESQMLHVLARFKTAPAVEPSSRAPLRWPRRQPWLAAQRRPRRSLFTAAAASTAAAVSTAALEASTGGFGGFHGGFGGFHRGFGFDHRFFGGFHRGFGFDHRFAFNHRFGFRRRFAFGGPGFFPGYAYDYAGYDDCLRRVWGPYGWRVINICY